MSPSISQERSDFDKALKKVKKRPKNENSIKNLISIYEALQTPNINEFNLALKGQDKSSPSGHLVTATQEYYTLKREFREAYNGRTRLFNSAEEVEDKAKSLLVEYYQMAVNQINLKSNNGYVSALNYLKYINIVDPNFNQLQELLIEALEKVRYNILIRINLGNSSEHERIMDEVLITLERRLNEFNDQNSTYYLSEDVDREYQKLIELSFTDLTIDNVSSKTNTDTYTKVIGGITKTGFVHNEIFQRNIRAFATISIKDLISQTSTESQQFNYRDNAKSINSSLDGDIEAINSFAIREAAGNKGTVIDLENSTLANLKNRITMTLELFMRTDLRGN
jgi:hypothetical protein